MAEVTKGIGLGAGLATAGVGTGIALLGGLLGAGGGSTQKLSDLPPELQKIFMESLVRVGKLSAMQAEELMQTPDAISLEELSSDVFGGDLSSILSEGLTGNATRAFEAENRAATADITGQLGAAGLRGGSTVGSGAIETSIGRNLLAATQLSNQTRSTIGGLALARRSQGLQLRGLRDANLQVALSNPLFGQLMQLRGAEVTTTQAGGGVGAAAGQIGGSLIEGGLKGINSGSNA